MRAIAVREAAPGDPGGGGPAFVDCMTYNTSGGRNGDKNMQLAVVVLDDVGNAISGATVSITLFLDGSPFDVADATTDSAGEASFSFKNAPNGLYTTDVTDVVGTGVTFDGTEPANSFIKGTDPTPLSFGSCGG